MLHNVTTTYRKDVANFKELINIHAKMISAKLDLDERIEKLLEKNVHKFERLQGELPKQSKI